MSERTIVTRHKGGTKEKRMRAGKIIVPDLWHVALRQVEKEDKERILECWHLAHDLRRHICESE